MTIQIFNIGASSSASIVTTSLVSAGSLVIAGVVTSTTNDPNLAVGDTAGNSYDILQPATLGPGGALAVSWAIIANDLPAGSKLIFPITDKYAAASAFYATGAGWPVLTQGFASGVGASPSGALFGIPWAGCLVFGFLGTAGPDGDAFNQDGSFFVPPVRAGTSRGAATHNRTIAGGSLIEGSAIVQAYSPTCTPRDWAVVMGAFQST